MLREVLTSTLLCLIIASSAVAGVTPNAPDGRSCNYVVKPAPFLGKVDAFRRKLIFFSKDAQLPVMSVKPLRGHPLTGEDRVAFLTPLLGESGCMVVGQEVLLSSSRSILRQTEDSCLPITVLKIERLAVAGEAHDIAGLVFDRFLAASENGEVLYLGLTDCWLNPQDPTSRTRVSRPDMCNYFVGRLDRKSNRLTTVRKEFSSAAVIDPKSDLVYICRENQGVLVRTDFGGKVDHGWHVDGWIMEAWLAPEGKSLLLSDNKGFRRLDVLSGEVMALPVVGRHAAWGVNGEFFYNEQQERDNDTVDTSLCRFRLGEKEKQRLFTVSRKRVKPNETFPDDAPIVSADRTWLAWPLPFKSADRATLIVDLKNNEYRIVDAE